MEINFLKTQTDPKVLREIKQVKQVLMAGIDKFNTESFSASFRYLQGKKRWK